MEGERGDVQQSEYCEGRSPLSSETQAALCSCRTGEDGRPVLVAAAGRALTIHSYVERRRVSRSGKGRIRGGAIGRVRVRVLMRGLLEEMRLNEDRSF